MATLAPQKNAPDQASVSNEKPSFIEPNGGFPEPAPEQAFRAVKVVHPECGKSTRIRIPGALNSSAVRRVCCSSCGQRFTAETVAEVHGPRVVGRILRMRRPRLSRPSQADLRLRHDALAPKSADSARSALASIDPIAPDTIPAAGPPAGRVRSGLSLRCRSLPHW